jgi:hypothetical protein
MSDTKKTPTKVDSITRADINRKAKALYTVTKKNGLNPKSRKLGCPLTFKMFSGPELKQGFRLAAEVSCYETLGSYNSTWSRDAPRKRIVLWIALANGLPVGMAGGYQKKSSFMLSIICTKKNAPGGCSNVGTHLMHQVEKSVRKMGLPYIELESIEDAIRFYTRLGFIRSANPCAARADKALADKKAKDQFDTEAQRYIAAGRPVPAFWHIFNGRFYPDDGRAAGEVILKKCVQKKKS